MRTYRIGACDDDGIMLCCSLGRLLNSYPSSNRDSHLSLTGPLTLRLRLLMPLHPLKITSPDTQTPKPGTPPQMRMSRIFNHKPHILLCSPLDGFTDMPLFRRIDDVLWQSSSLAPLPLSLFDVGWTCLGAGPEGVVDT